jgi:hypothetical protein
LGFSITSLTSHAISRLFRTGFERRLETFGESGQKPAFLPIQKLTEFQNKGNTLNLFQNSVSFGTGFRKSGLKHIFYVRFRITGLTELAFSKLKFWNNLNFSFLRLSNCDLLTGVVPKHAASE